MEEEETERRGKDEERMKSVDSTMNTRKNMKTVKVSKIK